ncbi:MAG TPA: cation diffusion facilitator family transporter [Polyangia bacterium]|nr:cation diffusion facilitator family transporter [Polyangia bacterium]
MGAHLHEPHDDTQAHDHGHAHGHDHGRGHAHGRQTDRRRLVGALAITALILIAEAIGGWLAHSLALLSDAGHMFSDVVAQALSLAALIIATRPADQRRTYGWHRVEILAALGNGLALVALAAIIVWEGWRRLHAPVVVDTTVMMPIAAIGLVANAAGVWLLHGSHSLNVKGAYLHILGDTLSSVAVLIGGAIMYFAHGLYWLDPALSIVIGLFIAYSSYALMRESVDVLLEAVPRDVDLAGVTHAIDAMPAVVAVHDLHVWTITSGLLALSAHIVVRQKDHAERDVLINEIKRVLAERYKISHTTLQIESESYEHECHVC